MLVVMVFRFMFNVSCLSLMFYVLYVLGIFCPELFWNFLCLDEGDNCLDCWGLTIWI